MPLGNNRVQCSSDSGNILVGQRCENDLALSRSKLFLPGMHQRLRASWIMSNIQHDTHCIEFHVFEPSHYRGIHQTRCDSVLINGQNPLHGCHRGDSTGSVAALMLTGHCTLRQLIH